MKLRSWPLWVVLFPLILVAWLAMMGQAFGADLWGAYRLRAEVCVEKKCRVHVSRTTFGQFACDAKVELLTKAGMTGLSCIRDAARA